MVARDIVYTAWERIIGLSIVFIGTRIATSGIAHALAVRHLGPEEMFIVLVIGLIVVGLMGAMGVWHDMRIQRMMRVGPDVDAHGERGLKRSEVRYGRMVFVGLCAIGLVFEAMTGSNAIVTPTLFVILMTAVVSVYVEEVLVRKGLRGDS